MAGINFHVLAWTMFMAAMAVCFHIGLSGPQQTEKGLICHTCNQTHYYDLCVNTLAGHPRSSSTDLTVLADIFVQLEKLKLAEAFQYVDKILEAIHDVKLRQLLYYCRIDYDNDVGFLEQVSLDLKNKMHIDAKRKLEPVLGDGAACEELFERANPVRKSPLTRRNKLIDEISTVIQDILNLLA